MVTPTDTLYANQTHFNLIGDIEAIWDDYTGQGISLGIYDDGIQASHSDLDSNYNSALEIVDGNGTVVSSLPDLTQITAGGTAVAGLIAAENNDAGTVGLAFNASITGINILSAATYGFKDYSTLAGQTAFLNAVDQAVNFDIMVNPWDSSPQFDAQQSQTSTDSFANLYVQHLAQNLSVGRGGLGTIVVQAAGDDGSDANGSGVNASRYTATVAVTDINGNASASANFGSSILIAAPIAAYTTDLIGNDGYNAIGTTEPNGTDPLPNTDYTSAFDGTPSATAITAGVIALMLEANPNLGWRDIQNILALSASDTGSGVGTDAVGFEQGPWAVNGANNWNGGGLSVNGSYGYGMINAFAAVRMAEAWSVIYDTSLTSTNEQEIESTLIDFGAGMAIPNDGSEASFEFVITDELSIEHIQLNMNFSHTFIGDMEVFLTGPSGQKIQVAYANNTPTDFTGDWIFGVDSFLGVLSVGTWTVSVSDAFTDANNGMLFSASLDFFGAPQTNDNTYHFTNDFLTYVAQDANRATLEDTNGGMDWINFAAVSGDITLSLISGSAFLADGTHWGQLGSGSDVFENAITGDGNDFITGNDLANELHGMRGNDRIIGGAGNDSIYGGDGTDTLNGGEGDDFIFGGTTSADLRDLVFAGAGDDSIDGGYGNDEIFGQGGNDTIAGGFGSDTLQGQDGNDVITGSALSDLVFGNAGDDFLNGGFGHDRVNGGSGADRFYHLGIFDHGSDFIQDYNAAEGDILLFGIANAARSQFQVNFNDAIAPNGEKAGDDTVQEAFVIYRPTGQIMWALIDGAGQSSINLQLGSEVFDLMA